MCEQSQFVIVYHNPPGFGDVYYCFSYVDFREVQNDCTHLSLAESPELNLTGWSTDSSISIDTRQGIDESELTLYLLKHSDDS